MKRLRWAFVLAVALGVSSFCLPALADPEMPTAQDRRVALVVSKLLQRDHLTEHAIDDEISQRCLSTFLKSLDPWKLYLLQSDIDRFEARQNELDDLIRTRDFDGFLSFSHTVYETLLERIDQAAKTFEELLAVEHDFTVDEEIIRDPDEVAYAQNEAEARDRWRKRIKFELLTMKADSLESKEGEEGGPFDRDEAVAKLRKRYTSRFLRAHQTDREDLLEIYLSALTTAFDPHTAYMSPDSLENFNIVMGLQLEGIGAALQSIDGETVVMKIIPGGAADKDGRLKVEDKIMGVGQGSDGEVEDVVNMKLKDVVNRIRGKRGTLVRLEVTSKESSDQRTIDITREKIELNDSAARGKIFDEGKTPEGQPYRFGVIDLPSFYMDMSGARRGVRDYRSSTVDVEKIIKEFRAEGVDAIVLDLRRNGGGSLTEAINLTGLFVGDEAVVVQVKGTGGPPSQYRAPRVAKSPGELRDRDQSRFVLDPEGCWSGPLVVLVSKFSASASEILAGAIQDYHRGLLVGDRATHGKGTVQSLMDLGQPLFGVSNTRDYGALKITMQQFYRPSGDSTQNRGVLADIELPSLTTHLDVSEADLDYPLPFDQVKATPFEATSFVDDNIRDRLSSLSSQRRKDSKDFQKLLKNIDRYLERKEEKTVSLNEVEFMAEVKEINADKEEKETIEEMNDSGDNGIERNYYLNEALAITVDYLGLLPVALAHAN
ncbi:MAG: carboxy terminal-processing peptidase [Planctomycetota bacterium]